MKYSRFVLFLYCLLLSIFHFDLSANEFEPTAYEKLKQIYEDKCNTASDINEHLPALKELAKKCNSAVEIGIRNLVSTWAILQGLSDNTAKSKRYVGIDLIMPPARDLNSARKLSQKNGIDYFFLCGNDMTIELEPADLLFIDSLHTYCHLMYELEKFSGKIRKYIVMHDTSHPWGTRNDSMYHGDYSEYPAHFDKTKKGLWPAVEDFLRNHPEWTLHKRYFNNHGLTILRRVDLNSFTRLKKRKIAD
jgi:hypothetical protein